MSELSHAIPLLFDDNKQKTIVKVPVSACYVSRFNTRKTRNPEKISDLAQRIERNGFEVTRALWVYPASDGYEVFAGGNRLEASKQAGLETVPVVLHEGFTEDEVARLADEDNANDEYHDKVSIVDVWAEYARLAHEEGWPQQRIAEAKGVSQTSVALRLRYNGLPYEVKDLVLHDILTEGHLKVISVNYCTCNKLADWLTSEQVVVELALKINHDAGKNGSKSVKAATEDAKRWKEFIAYAEAVHNELPTETQLYDKAVDGQATFRVYNPQAAFVAALADKKARSLAAVKEAEHAIHNAMRSAEKAYQDFLNGKASSDAAAEAKRQREQHIIGRYRHGDCIDLLPQLLDSGELQPKSVRLLITDPPFGKAFKSNRRWQTQAPEMIANDKEQEQAYQAVRAMLEAIDPAMMDESHVLMKADWSCVAWMRELLKEQGWTLKQPVIWVKEEHSAGDVYGGFAPSHEIVLHASRNGAAITPRIRDVIQATRTRETSHALETPVSLWQPLINSTTSEGQLILDPFAGTGSTAVTAQKLNRDWLAIELSEDYRNEGLGRLL